MERGERWLSLVIFFSFLRINFRGRRDSHESHLPLFGTIYFPTAPFVFEKLSVSVQGDNTVDKGLISVSFALLSFRVRPVRVNQAP